MRNIAQRTSNDLERFLTAAEAAQMLRLADGTLANLRSRGEGPPYTRVGDRGRILYRLADIEDWLATRRVVPAAECRQNAA